MKIITIDVVQRGSPVVRIIAKNSGSGTICTFGSSIVIILRKSISPSNGVHMWTLSTRVDDRVQAFGREDFHTSDHKVRIDGSELESRQCEQSPSEHVGGGVGGESGESMWQKECRRK